MGCINAKPAYLDPSVCNGDLAEYKKRWTEGAVLGEGEFGKVRLVTSKEEPTRPQCAMKEVKKGIQFKHNVAYPPMDPATLQAEVACLQQLQGQQFNLKLEGLYESASALYIVTELCTGGEMLQYVAQGTMQAGLRTEDMSRIAFQLVSAVAHCASKGILHRDIKPENTMFVSPAPGADLRLIDYGCATLNNGKDVHNTAYDTLQQHTTMAGTPFYLAPEVFQEMYTTRADSWSVGVTLLVLVAGFPADQTQRAFNLLHRNTATVTNKKTAIDVHNFPGMPENMPTTYGDMINALLTYKPKQRTPTCDVVQYEFPRMHQELLLTQNNVDVKTTTRRKTASLQRTPSVLFPQTGKRHSAYMDYKKYERAVTTILATIPSPDEFAVLLQKLEEQNHTTTEIELHPITKVNEKDENGVQSQVMVEALGVIEMEKLEELLMTMGLIETIRTMEELPNASDYKHYSFQFKNLRHFSGTGASSSNQHQNGGRRKNSSLGLEAPVANKKRNSALLLSKLPQVHGNTGGRRQNRQSLF